MRLLAVFSGIALLCAPAMAQAPFIPEQAVTDWNTMTFQWTNQSTELAWNLYDVVTDDTSLPTQPDPVYREGWVSQDSFDIGTGRNDYLEGNMDLDGGGIPDEYDMALVGAVRYGTAGDGGALLFPNFQAEYDFNNDAVISDLASLGGTTEDWTGWTAQRIWYAGLQTLSADWIATFDGTQSFFGHADGSSQTIVGGSYDGSPDGDLDGDGLTNLQEYQANIGDPWAFALAAITPGAGGTEQDASVAYRAVAGDSVCYDVTNPGTAGPGDFTWTFDDGTGAVTLEGVVDGQLCFNPLTEADAGTYVASFDDGDEAAKVGNTFTLVLEVLPEGTPVPASTNWTLFITMLAVLLSGAALMYGRKKGLGAKG
jgi:hypothetical protein